MDIYAYDEKKVSTAAMGAGVMLISWGGQEFISGNYAPGGFALVMGVIMFFISEYYKEQRALRK